MHGMRTRAFRVEGVREGENGKVRFLPFSTQPTQLPPLVIEKKKTKTTVTCIIITLLGVSNTRYGFNHGGGPE